MAFEELLIWSNRANGFSWHKDALRRLAPTGELTEDDLAALCAIIEHDVGLLEGESVPVVPLAACHLRSDASDHRRTIIGSIGPVRGIDRLAGDQPSIKFPKKGIALIYGANGSGKSGYCRIVRELCKRSAQPVLVGDIYQPPAGTAKEVDLTFAIDDSDEPRREVTWREGEAPPPELSRIEVFDSGRAGVYVDGTREITFLPYELDRLNKLAVAAVTLERRFSERDQILARAIAVPLGGEFGQGTAVGEALATLVPGTSLADLPSEKALCDLATWNDDMETEYERLSERLKDTPAMRARNGERTRTAMEAIERELVPAFDLLDDEGIARLRTAHATKTASAQASDAAARGLGTDMPIDGIGSDAWQSMVRYAREFAAEIFPNGAEPPLATAPTCVLCQQGLATDAAARLSRFDAYISGRAAREAGEAKDAYDTIATAVDELGFVTAATTEALLAPYAAENEARAAFVKRIVVAFEQLIARAQAVELMVTVDRVDIDVEPDLPPLDAELLGDLSAALKTVKDEIEKLPSGDEEKKRANALMVARAKLKDHRQLSERIDAVLTRRAQLIERWKIDEARKQCGTAGINRQLSVRRKAILTDELRRRLANELDVLKLNHLPISLTSRVKKTDLLVDVSLDASQNVAKIGTVLSEGEQRVLALSCFLAELEEDDTKHAIVVDDPVSSLDHERMEAVAQRLVALAKDRQVIVFTHSIVFHNLVDNAAVMAQLPCHTEWMMGHGSARSGVIGAGGHPPHKMKITARIAEIRQSISKLHKKKYDPNDAARFRDDVTAIYTRMREAWERVIEEVIFAGVIERFNPEVSTLKMRSVCFDPAKDNDELFRGMKRCSQYSGHDRARALPERLPDIEEIDTDLEYFNEYFNKMDKRRRDLDKVKPDARTPTEFV